MSTPADCNRCRAIFLRRLALQAEVHFEDVKFGAAAATALLNERLEGDHEQHAASPSSYTLAQQEGPT
jgi:hypothetical protein